MNIHRLDEVDELHEVKRLHSVCRPIDEMRQGHNARVAEISMRIAKALGLAEDETRTISIAASLHDIGKVSVPKYILSKPGPLTELERHRVQDHAAAGAQLLSAYRTGVLRLARVIALTHHEWWDGNGYPTRRSGIEIPLPSRIVAIADVFDALTSVRPYKPAWSVASAVAEIGRLSGTQFDPRVVKAFESLQVAA